MTKPSAPPMSRREADRLRLEAQQAAIARQELERLKGEEEARRHAKTPGGFGLNLDALALKSGSDIEFRDIEDNSKKVTRFARRVPNTVWARLGAPKKGGEPTLSPSLVYAGETLVEIYATQLGMAGARDRDPAAPPPSSSYSRDGLPVRMLEAANLYARIMRAFGHGSRYPAMFEALCQDCLETKSQTVVTTRKTAVYRFPKRDPYEWGTVGQKTETVTQVNTPGQPKDCRWREIVAATMGEGNPNAQGVLVRIGCEQLSKILEQEIGSVTGGSRDKPGGDIRVWRP